MVDDHQNLLSEVKGLNYGQCKHRNPHQQMNQYPLLDGSDHILAIEEWTQEHNDTQLQLHVLFWDRDGDGIIYPRDIYNGFRDLGFNIFISFIALLIPFFFSYPSSIGRSWFPDPLLRIYVDDIHKCKHGSDTNVFTPEGHFNSLNFEEMLARFDSTGNTQSFSLRDMYDMIARNRCAADPFGWSASFMEWTTTWMLLQRDGRVSKEDLRQMYSGFIFWKIHDEWQERIPTLSSYEYYFGNLFGIWKDVAKGLQRV